MKARNSSAGVAFVGVGIAFIAIGASGRNAFIAIGLAFLAIGLAAFYRATRSGGRV
ncbi:MAG: hypothetical protein ABI592_08460 [Acidobacteriota bacterium]